ncbi:HNH endonuclease [Ramlibacter sp. AN1133]|uniref:HNH endonuclease n=1 Tax=Ramlibacter sp. AN1133 TaxID=3133429 RepID=UPI0030C4121A
MKHYFVNTDKARQPPDDWIRLGIAVTTDTERNRDLLTKISSGDGVLMYVNLEGVLAVGEATPGAVVEVRDPAAMVNPKERVEFHRPVRWLIDLRGSPLPYSELPKFAGVQPRQSCQEVMQGREWILQRLRGLAVSATQERQAEARASEVLEDVERVRGDGTLDPTTRESLIQARVGQGKFRRDLIAEFGRCCAATALTVLPVLRASHVVPWRRSTDEERLDPSNGLLLSANLDALFDRALITFDEQGDLHVSRLVSDEQRAMLGISRGLQIRPTSKRAVYLRRHNDWFREVEAVGMDALGLLSE